MYIATWGRDLISSISNNTNLSNKTAFGAGWEHIDSRIQRKLSPTETISKLNDLATAIKEGGVRYTGKRKLLNNYLYYPTLHTFVSKDGDIVCINNGKRNNGMPFPEIVIQDSGQEKTTRILGSTLDDASQSRAIKKTIKAFEAIIPKRKPKQAKTLSAQVKTPQMVQTDRLLQLA